MVSEQYRRVDQRTEGNRRPPGVAALVGQRLDALQRSGPILYFVSTFQDLLLNLVFTFQYLVLYFVSTFHYLRHDFSSTSPHLFSSLALVVLKFLSRKLTTSRVFPEGKL